MAIAKMLLNLNVKDIVLCDINGALSSKSEGLNWAQKEMSANFPSWSFLLVTANISF